MPTDVTDEMAVRPLVDRAADRFGGIDVWVNNAMVTVFSDVARLQPDELRRVTDVTYHGAAWGTMAALRSSAQVRALPRRPFNAA